MNLRTTRCLAVVFASLCVCQLVNAVEPQIKLGLEPEWLPVDNLVADACTPTLSPSKSAPLSRLVNEPRTCVCIRGIYPVAEQLRILRSASQAAPSAGITLMDLKIERQTLALDAKSSVIPKWEDVSLRPAMRILQATRQQAETIAKDRVSQVMTMSLPERVDGVWGALAGHPLLGDAPPGDLMFRYFDFDVESGHFYRYRVKLVLRNPNRGGWSSDPFVTKGSVRETPWSQPSPAVLTSDEEE